MERSGREGRRKKRKWETIGEKEIEGERSGTEGERSGRERERTGRER